MKSASIIIPTYNYAVYLERCILSVIEAAINIHDYTFEIIVVDDASTDNTRQVLGDIIKKYPQVKYIEVEKCGKAAASAVAIKFSRGDIIFNLDADDTFLPDKLKEVLSVYDTYPDIVHVSHPALFKNIVSGDEYSEGFPIELLNKCLNGTDILRFYLENNLLLGGGSTFSARRVVFNYFEFWQESDMYCDELLCFLALVGGKCYYLDLPLSVWFIHGGNYSVGSKDVFSSQLKMKRLLKSSEGLLHFIDMYENVDMDVKNLYRFKHLIRKIYQSQLYNRNKEWLFTLAIILQLYFLIGLGHPKLFWLLARKYHLVYRIMPPFLYLLLKK